MNFIVTCEKVWKTYHHRIPVGIKELIVKGGDRPRNQFARIWALREVSFDVARGQSLGIIGRNGTGKSTLLSLLLGTILPDKGRIEVDGRIAPLLEIGAGFHPDLTGKENVFLYGCILGMTIYDIKQRYDRIVDFSDLRDVIDNPIRTYSNGMIARLGFSTIIHAPVDLILIDEVLAVGDNVFQEKCLKFFRNFTQQNGSLVIVSHDMETIKNICDEAIYLDNGLVVAKGKPTDVVERYRNDPANSDSAGASLIAQI